MSARATWRISKTACAMALACLLAGLVACAGGASVTHTSPQANLASAHVAASSNLTEESQLVDVAIPFDSSLTVADPNGIAAASDFSITLDGDPVNAKTTTVRLSADGANLHVQLGPSPEAQGPDTPLYFACYQGKLRIAPASRDGSLPHIVGNDGAAAVMESALELTIPSGMRIAQVDSQAGSATVEVEQFAQIRCCTWFDIGGTRLFMHHHRFAQESNQTCATAMAETIANASGGAYSASADGARVLITALGENADRPFDVRIVEGVGA